MAQRLLFYWRCGSPLFKWVGAVFSVLGFLTLVRDEILPPIDPQTPNQHLFQILPHWSLQTWIMFFVVLVAAAVLEGAYQNHLEHEAAKAKGADTKKLWLSESVEYIPPVKRGIFRIALPLAFVVAVVTWWAVSHQKHVITSRSIAQRGAFPSVVLVPEGDTLRLYNRSDTDLSLWGDKLDDTARDIGGQARIIPKEDFYYFLTDRLKEFALKDLGQNGEKLYPFEVYLSDNQQHYIAKFYLLIQMTDGRMTVHTQQLGVAATDWSKFATAFPTAVPSPTVSPIEYYSTPLTPRQIFDTDFPYLSIGDNLILTRKNNGQTTAVPVRLFYNFDDKSKFIAFFVPRQVSADETYDACMSLVNQYKMVMQQLDERMAVGDSKPGETSETWSKDLTFTGRIYVYYEDDLSLSQLAALDDLYKGNGLFPEFRGQAYMALHWHEKRAVRQSVYSATIRAKTE